jgi:hypothetical protein
MENNMAEYTVTDIIDFAIDGNVNKMKDAVEDLMKERVAEILANKRIEVAKAFFNPEE